MIPRYRVGLLVASVALIGCDGSQYSGPILYRDHERMTRELAEKPRLRSTIKKALVDLYGEDLRHIKVPEDSGLRGEGIYLGNLMKVGEKVEPVVERDAATGKSAPVEGGYALYRKHCLHCHGVAGAGDGPTAEYLYPRPRDYRPGIFKFTSTNPVDAKPTRADLRKTLLYGLHGTSMPGFEAIMSASQIEQLIDYTIFLSMRGETERYLIDEAINNNDSDAESALGEDIVKEMLSKVVSSWKAAETQVVNPSTRRAEPSRESILRGRDFFLGTNVSGNKLECIKCHGASGKGNGPSFIELAIFNDVVFRQWPLDQAIDRFYQGEKSRAEAASHSSKQEAVKPDPDGVAKFLTDNPTFLTHLRKRRGLMSELTDKEFAAISRGKYDLQLISQVKDASGLPASGRGLIIVAVAGQVLHFRIFDTDGRRVADTDATKLSPQASPIEELRKQLEGLGPPHELTESERTTILASAASITGNTPRADMAKVTAEARKLLPDLDDPEFRTFLLAKMEHWTKSLDFWGNPLRPANLIDGTFKGGQRPLDLYWRLAKGINGAQMPAHAGVLSDDQIWDVVNFVLAVRDDPGLLPESLPGPDRPTSVAASR